MSDMADLTQAREEKMMADFLHRFTRTEKPIEVLERDCIDCGQAIPLARLKIIPHCVRCVTCQEDREK